MELRNLSVLNRKKVKRIFEIMENQWSTSVNEDYVFLLSRKEKVYIMNKEIGELDISNMRIDSIGMYLCEYRNDDIRLSIEGSQMIGPNAKQNVLELTETELQLWIRGYDIEFKDKKDTGFLIIKSGNDYFGTGKIKSNKLLNFYPKTRRIKSADSDF